MFILDETVVG